MNPDPPGAGGAPAGEDPREPVDAAGGARGASGADEPEQQEQQEQPAGADLARTALGRARAAAAAKGLRPGRAGQGAPAARAAERDARRQARRDASARSGAWPDARDPQQLGSTLGRLVGERGWERPVAVGGAFGRWDAVVGPELAGHCAPESLREGTLVVRAESTAWATQVRLLTSVLVRRLDEELGQGVVTRVVVRGPQGPSWRRGGRSASGGRGPRDTYG
ncbi:DciA family protein [Kineococcus sp. SYSU DK005]|uniref:DUF721 domain-containing protein n=1 Tax=Kineococcus sp. SYSU DK005 TaxID=3383126 RepID=UPI003D7CF3BC